jgi:hypothetical protein
LKRFTELNGQSLISFFENSINKKILKGQSLIVFSEKEENKLIIQLIQKLSFTHLVQLLPIDNEEKRSFYEQECIRGTWSVRELRRQIDSLYYERTVMSKKPELLKKAKKGGNVAKQAKKTLEKQTGESIVTSKNASDIKKLNNKLNEELT